MREIKFKLLFKKKEGDIISRIYLLSELISMDLEFIYENLEYECTSSSCNTESQNFCDCEYEDYELFKELQYIGLEDLNEKEAYEDDLIRYKYYHENGEKVIGIAKIYFDGGCYFLEDIKTKHKYPIYLADLSFEIVGNIHENKDLLK